MTLGFPVLFIYFCFLTNDVMTSYSIIRCKFDSFKTCFFLCIYSEISVEFAYEITMFSPDWLLIS